MRRFLYALIALWSCAILSSGSFAQAVPAGYPPLFPNVDRNGVDLTSGGFSFRPGVVSVGGGTTALPLDLTHDLYTGNLYIVTSGTTHHAYIVMGDNTVVFTNTGSGFVPAVADGSSLSNTTQTYTYTDRSGIIYKFFNLIPSYTPGYPCTDLVADNCFLLTTISKPDGEVLSLNWNTQTRCSGHNLPCTPNRETSRLTSVVSNFGYEILFGYASNDFGTGIAPPVQWAQRTSATLYNLAYCQPSTGCTDHPWAIVTYVPGGSLTDYSQITDPLSRVWGIAYGTGGITGIKWPSSSTANVTIGYATNGSVSTVTIGGQTWHYNYVVSGTTATETVTDPLSHITVVTSDLNVGRQTSVKDALNHTTTYAYDTGLHLSKVTYPEGNYVQYTYDTRGNATQTLIVPKAGSGLSNLTLTANYDTTCTNSVTCNQPNWTKDAKGNETDYAYDTTTGQMMSVTSPAPTVGAVRPQKRFAYTSLQAYYYVGTSSTIVASGTPISMLTGISSCQTTASCSGLADEVKTTASYGLQTAGTPNNLLPVLVSKGAGDNSLTATSAIAYDVYGNPYTVDGPLAGTADTTRYHYDADRELTGVVGPDPDGAGILKNRAQRITYNPNGLVTLAEQGTVLSQSDPDWANFVTLQQVATSYDSSDRKAQDTAQAGGTTYAVVQYSYDAASRLDCTAQRMNSTIFGSLPTSACTLGTTGSYGPDRISRNGYDAANQFLSVITGYGVTTANGFPATLQRTEATATYSNNGKQLTLADAKNNLTTYIYDGFDRLSKSEYPSPTTAGTSSTTDYEQLGYDANSNVMGRRLRGSTAAVNTFDIAYGYDALNRETTMSLPATGNPSDSDTTYSYDLIGHLLLANDTNGHKAQYTYDALGRQLTEASLWASKASQYDLAGRRTRLTWQDGFYVTYDYDNVDEMTGIHENGGTTVLASFTYDDLGQRKTRTLANGTSTTYGFDPISRLSSLTLAGGVANNTVALSSYSPAGEIGSRAETNDAFAWTAGITGSNAYTSNGLNQYKTFGTATPTYDVKGNTTSIGTGTTYTYNSKNQISAAGTPTFYYDALGRLDTEATATRLDYDGADLITELNTSNAVQRRYVFGPGGDEPIVWYEGSGTTTKRYMDQDERGSITRVSDGTGATVALNSYDEYGMPASTNLGRFGYTGQGWLPEIGMWYYKARIYSSQIGRFMQTDPIGYGDGPNWYNYVRSNPINWTDPSGTTDEDGNTQCGGPLQPPCTDPIIVNGGGSGGGVSNLGGGTGIDTSGVVSTLPNIVETARRRPQNANLDPGRVEDDPITTAVVTAGVAGVASAVDAVADAVGEDIVVTATTGRMASGFLPGGMTASQFGSIAGFPTGLDGSAAALGRGFFARLSAARMAARNLRAAGVSADAVSAYAKFYSEQAAANPGNISAVYRAKVLYWATWF